MAESLSYLKSHRNSMSKQKVSRQLFADPPLLANHTKNTRLTQYDEHSNIIQASTQTSRQFCKAYKKQIAQNSQQKSKIKNQQSSDYIRNLYKKYLGKQNNSQTHSQRKLRTDIKQNKRTMITQTYRQSEASNASSRKQKISSIIQENRKSQKNIFLKKQHQKTGLDNSGRDTLAKAEVFIKPLNLNKQFYVQEKNKHVQLSKVQQVRGQVKKDWYRSLLGDDFALNIIDAGGNSILTALKNIKSYKQGAKY